MSWQPPPQRKPSKIILPPGMEDARLANLEADNVRKVPRRFVCEKCGSGWDFCRTNTIECCGLTYILDR